MRLSFNRSSRSQQCAFIGPASAQATVYEVMGNSEFSRPSKHVKRLSPKGETYIFTRVRRLFQWSCPFAILFAIAAVVINPLNRQSRRADAHVGKEVFKSKPSLANSNSSSSIISELIVGLISATPQHVFPTSVGSCSGHSVSFLEASPLDLRERQFYLNSRLRHGSFMYGFSGVTVGAVTFALSGSHGEIL